MGGDWEKLIDASVHPTQVEIVSAMEWLEGPVSSVILTEVLDKKARSLSHVGYHMRKLESHGILRLESTRPVRGTVEHFYLLGAA